MAGKSAFVGSDEDSGECRTHAHTFPTSSHCPQAAEPCCAAFEPQGGTKGTRQPSGITSSSSIPWVSTELLLFTTRYAVIRLRSRECVASLPPIPMQRHLRSGTASVAWLPPKINKNALVPHSHHSCPAVCTPPSLISLSLTPSPCSHSTLPFIFFQCKGSGEKQTLMKWGEWKENWRHNHPPSVLPRSQS